MKTKQENSIVSRLQELVDLAGPEFVHENIELFFQAGRKEVAKMKSAIQTSSADIFMNSAHSLKATSLNLGAFELSESCQVAETQKAFQNKTTAQASLLAIENKLTIVENFLRGYIKESHSSAS